jgi:hypothetical protein
MLRRGVAERARVQRRVGVASLASAGRNSGIAFGAGLS